MIFNLKPEDTTEFQRLYKKHYEIDLSVDEAKEIFERFLQFLKAIREGGKKEQKKCPDDQ
ncbi:MAG: hypothetical protein PHZ00_03770 [Candidatus Peribacteraceae bacterium]|nr:hypothetical protein [Candidatus Peribacteraceae bacterium]